MQPLKARVEHGRLKLDEPTDLPDGEEVSLVIADDWDELNDGDRAELHQALEESIEQAQAGDVVDAEVVLAELRFAREGSVYAKGEKSVEGS